jgi:glycosyl hydrolase family 115 (putative glucuronidase)/glycosyl hydrolase family 115
MSNVRDARLRCAENGEPCGAARQRRAYRWLRQLPWLYVLHSLIVFSVSATTFAQSADKAWIHDRYVRGDFALVQGGNAADLLVSPSDFKVVQIAAREFADDVQRVTGKSPRLVNEPTQASRYSVIIGTLGQSPLIDSLVRAGKLNVEQLRGKWETFIVATVSNPLPNVGMGLVIAGSDRRGTAFGVFELSQAIGVSPWYWWADVPSVHRDNLFVAGGTRRAGPPSVRYRGIFLNDEDLGLQPWAAKTFDPQLGDIGPKTYARIFELLLRLKANTLWPAMHNCTKAFNLYPDNKVVADDYAIVMGSSHAEPMLRNNVTEWSDKPENYDYTRNADGVRKYWEDRVAQNGKYENIYTLGMRGIHDSPIVGPKTQPERIKVIEQIFNDQRAMLANHVNPDATKVPQIFCPYKEVLADYRAGLKVPDDVTIVWPDDNHGYIRYFPTAAELKRPGGFGVYYHASYLGGPLSYIWLDSTPPGLIWEEMSRAFDHGVRKFWMLNVGDLKPAEISIDLFLQMGWDATRWRRDNLNQFLERWAASQFGPQHASEIARVLDQYYRLGFARKPEFLQWNLINEKPRLSDLTAVDYGDEVEQRLDEYDALMKEADRLYEKIPPSQRDAFYELVVYPARAAALANRRYFSFEKAAQYLAQGRASAIECARRGQEADQRLTVETDYYNQKLAAGKWRHMMTVEPPNGQWQNMRMTTPRAPPALTRMEVPEAAGLGVAIEGRVAPVRPDERGARLPVLSVFTRDARFIDVFNTGRRPASWSAKVSHPWIKLSKSNGDLTEDARINISIDWLRAPKGENGSGTIEIQGAGSTCTITVPIFNPGQPRPEVLKGFIESNGVVSIEAEHFTHKIDRPGSSWQIVPGLGRTGDSIAIFPTTAATLDPASAPVVEYEVYLFTPGTVKTLAYLVPTHPIASGHGLRYAIGFDAEPPQLVDVDADLQIPSRAWSLNVLNSSTTGTSTHEIKTAGQHVLRIYAIDPGVVLDKIVLDLGGLKPSYLGPGETVVR